jgi:hypothetical protein
VSKKQTIPPNQWTDVGFGLQVKHVYPTNKIVHIFGGGTVDLVGAWRVRSVGVKQTPTNVETKETEQ